MRRDRGQPREGVVPVVAQCEHSPQQPPPLERQPHIPERIVRHDGEVAVFLNAEDRHVWHLLLFFMKQNERYLTALVRFIIFL